MKTILKIFRNFFLIFALFVALSIIMAKSKDAREFVTPGKGYIEPDLEVPQK